MQDVQLDARLQHCFFNIKYPAVSQQTACMLIPIAVKRTSMVNTKHYKPYALGRLVLLHIQISWGSILAMLIEGFHIFPQSLQKNEIIDLKLAHDCFHPQLLQFTVH
jgi:hypothetical protein